MEFEYNGKNVLSHFPASMEINKADCGKENDTQTQTLALVHGLIGIS